MSHNYTDQLRIAEWFTRRVKSVAVSLDVSQVRAWLFGEGYCAPETATFLEGVCGFFGYDHTEYTDESFYEMMKQIVGEGLAMEALEIAKEINRDFNDE